MNRALRERDDGISSDRIGNFVVAHGDLVTTMERGSAFGELALISPDGLRNASVIASNSSTDVEILALSRESYMKSLMPLHVQALEMEEKIKTLKDLMIFSSWTRSRMIVLSYVVSLRITWVQNLSHFSADPLFTFHNHHADAKEIISS
jgi:hypothetical protein